MFTIRTSRAEYLFDGETLTQISMMIFLFSLMGILLAPLF